MQCAKASWLDRWSVMTRRMHALKQPVETEESVEAASGLFHAKIVHLGVDWVS